MVITRKNIIKYFASEPVRRYCENCVSVNEISFPDVKTLSPDEKNVLRPVLESHPEYLLEVWCDRKRIH
jgi:hypothetical protein